VSLVGGREEREGTERLIQWSSTVPRCEGRGCTWLEDPAHCPPFAANVPPFDVPQRRLLSLFLFSFSIFLFPISRRSIILLKLFPTIFHGILIWFVCSLDSFKKSRLSKIRFSFNVSRQIGHLSYQCHLISNISSRFNLFLLRITHGMRVSRARCSQRKLSLEKKKKSFILKRVSSFQQICRTNVSDVSIIFFAIFRALIRERDDFPAEFLSAFCKSVGGIFARIRSPCSHCQSTSLIQKLGNPSRSFFELRAREILAHSRLPLFRHSRVSL